MAKRGNSGSSGGRSGGARGTSAARRRRNNVTYMTPAQSIAAGNPF